MYVWCIGKEVGFLDQRQEADMHSTLGQCFLLLFVLCDVHKRAFIYIEARSKNLVCLSIISVLPSSPTPFIDTESLTKSKAFQVWKASWSLIPRDPPVSASPVLRLEVFAAIVHLPMIAGIELRFVIVKQTHTD